MKATILQSFLLTILAFTHTGILSAQYIPMAEESKHWIYYDFQKMPRPTTGFLITIQGDTIVEKTPYKKVYKYELGGEVKTVLINEPPVFVPDIPYNLIEKELVSLIREDTNERIVYNLPIKLDSCTEPLSANLNPCNDIIFCDTLEHILYDFSLGVGDTLNYCSYAPLHYQSNVDPDIIDSIKFEMHFGKLRKTFFTFGIASYLPNLVNPGPQTPSQVRIIEGIGFQNQGIYNYRFGSLVYYCEGDFDDCNIISGTEEVHSDENQVKIYPNPASDHLTIESNERIVKISLMDANSKELISVINENKINLNHIPVGFYICSIQLENGKVINKKIVKWNR